MRRPFHVVAFAAVAALFTGAACGDDAGSPDAAIPDARLIGFAEPDLICPGGPTCASAGDGVLYVGAGKHDITPPIPETYTDENMNQEYDRDEPYVDANGNDEFDGIWLFGGGRAANGVHTTLDARALAFRQGDTTVVVLYIDAIGVLLGDMEQIRAHPLLADLDIDHVIIGATHAHSTPDTIGLWGANEFKTGRVDSVITGMIDGAAAAVKAAVDSAVPAQMVIANALMLNDPADTESRTDRYNKDIRDPVIFDPTMTIAQFVRADAPTTTIGTLVNWADHPEVSHFEEDVPVQISAHFPFYLRNVIEGGLVNGQLAGLDRDLPGLGGITVFVQGALGGQIGSLRGTAPLAPDGNPITEVSYEMEEAIGTNVARRALEVLTDEGEEVTDLPLTMRSAPFHGRIDNLLFQAAFLIELLGPHPLVGYNPDDALGPGNEPWMPMRSTYLQIGPLGLITAPGELHPELWVGGYDGSWTWGWDIMDTSKPNTPDLGTAPQGPYLRDLVLANPGVRFPVLAGCSEDYIGYIVPAYNYVLHPSNPYIDEAEGDHYEEVYTLGPEVEAHSVHPILDLAAYGQ